MIVSNPGAVAQQCSSTKIPIFDPTIIDQNERKKKKNFFTNKKTKKKIQHHHYQHQQYQQHQQHRQHHHRRQREKLLFKKINKFTRDDESIEGSGYGGSSFNKTDFG